MSAELRWTRPLHAMLRHLQVHCQGRALSFSYTPMFNVPVIPTEFVQLHIAVYCAVAVLLPACRCAGALRLCTPAAVLRPAVHLRRVHKCSHESSIIGSCKPSNYCDQLAWTQSLVDSLHRFFLIGVSHPTHTAKNFAWHLFCAVLLQRCCNLNAAFCLAASISAL